MKIINIISILATANAAGLGQDSVPGTDIDANAYNHDAGAYRGEVKHNPTICFLYYFPYGSHSSFFSIVNALLEHCGDESAALLVCYGGDNAAVMTCTNCAWEQLLTSGVECDGLEEEVEADYSA